jgi:uncharacterized protein YecT (DUF1311 family)
MKRLFFFLLIFLQGAVAHTAGFDCKSSSLTQVETMICADSNLSGNDSHLNSLFKKALTVSTEQEKAQLVEEQRRWLRDVRDNCSSTVCLQETQTRRLGSLADIYQERSQTRIPNDVLNELSHRSGFTVTELREVLSDCPNTQLSMNMCMFRSAVEADLKMAKELAKIQAKLPQTCHATLKATQSKWENDTDRRCNKAADDEAEGGSMRPMIFSGCRVETAEQRIIRLKSIRSCETIR